MAIGWGGVLQTADQSKGLGRAFVLGG